MSNAISKAEERYEEGDFAAHVNRLQYLGYRVLAGRLQAIQETLLLLEDSHTTLPRHGWERLDRLKRQVKELM